MKTFTHPNRELRCNCTHSWDDDISERKVIFLDSFGPDEFEEQWLRKQKYPVLYEYWSEDHNHPLIDQCPTCKYYKWEIVE